jgi:hypothetical protein
MFKASANVMLPTSIIGSLPRPSWYTAVLGNKSFLEAMVNSRYREQYEDAVSCFVRAQEVAGLDIVTDGDAHYDEEVGGMSWQSYPLTHMAGFAAEAEPAVYNVGAVAYPRGHIPARLPRGAGVSAHHRRDRARQSAVHRDVEDRAAHHQAAGEVRHHPARTAGGLGRGRSLQGPDRADLGVLQCDQSGAQ